MRRLQHTTLVAAFLGLALTAAPAHSFFHLWDFSEVFSSDDGSVQFIEFFTTSQTETQANGVQIRSMSTGNIFTFTGSLAFPSNNKRLLVATTGFASLPGLSQTPPLLMPNYTIPANFFNKAGDTIRLCNNPCNTPGINIYDARTFGPLPTDGVNSLHFLPSVMEATNSPTNYLGTTGSVDLTPAPPVTTGDYNLDLTVDAADYTVWRDTFGQTGVPLGSGADGIADGTIDTADYDFWKLHFGDVIPPGAGSASAVPEPAALILAIIGLLTVSLAAVRARQ